MKSKWWAYIEYPSHISHISVETTKGGERVSVCGLVELAGETRPEMKSDRRCIICAGRQR